MKLLFLHGAPAAGKLTIAKALLRLVPGRLMDNHAAIDLALTVFDFGAPGFWELVHDVRLSALDAAARLLQAGYRGEPSGSDRAEDRRSFQAGRLTLIDRA